MLCYGVMGTSLHSDPVDPHPHPNHPPPDPHFPPPLPAPINPPLTAPVIPVLPTQVLLPALLRPDLPWELSPPPPPKKTPTNPKPEAPNNCEQKRTWGAWRAFGDQSFALQWDGRECCALSHRAGRCMARRGSPGCQRSPYPGARTKGVPSVGGRGAARGARALWGLEERLPGVCRGFYGCCLCSGVWHGPSRCVIRPIQMCDTDHPGV